MKELQISLYEIFGYLLPGAIALSAITIFHWTLFIDTPFVFPKIDWPITIGILAMAYLTGHVLQGVSNAFLGLKVSIRDVLDNGPHRLPESIRKAAHELARTLLPASSSNLPSASLYELCDTYIQQRGKQEMREIFLYREGFYRGMLVASLLLSCAFLLRSVCQISVFEVTSFRHSFTRGEMLFFCAASAAASLVFFLRHRRFGRYLIRNAVVSAVVLKNTESTQSLK